MWARAPSSGQVSRARPQQRALALQRSGPFCSACGRIVALLCLPAGAPVGSVVWEPQEEAWGPSEPAGSYRPLPPASASPPPAPTHAHSPHRAPQAQMLWLLPGPHPCSGPLTPALGWEKRPASARQRTLASCCCGDGPRSECRCELRAQRCGAHAPPQHHQQQAGETMLLPWQRGGWK